MQSYSRYQPPPSPLPPEISVEDGCGMRVRTYDESLVPYRPPPFLGSWPKKVSMGEVYHLAPPPFIGSWPNNTGTIGVGSNKSKENTTTKGKGLL